MTCLRIIVFPYEIEVIVQSEVNKTRQFVAEIFSSSQKIRKKECKFISFHYF